MFAYPNQPNTATLTQSISLGWLYFIFWNIFYTILFMSAPKKASKSIYSQCIKYALHKIQQKSVHLLKGNDWSLIRSQMLHRLIQTYLAQTKPHYLVNLSPNQLFLESCSI